MDSYVLRYNSLRMAHAFKSAMCIFTVNAMTAIGTFYCLSCLGRISSCHFLYENMISKRFTSLKPVFFCQTSLNNGSNLDGKYNNFCDFFLGWNHC